MNIDRSPQAEAQCLLYLHGGEVAKAPSHVEQHLGVLQTRSQCLLTIGTLMLTITGFFGPKVAPSTFSTIGLSLGLIFGLGRLGAVAGRFATHSLVDVSDERRRRGHSQ